MMDYREATADDVEAIVRMAVRFQASTEYARHLRATPESLRQMTRTVLESPDGVIWLAWRHERVVGMLAAALYSQPMSGERVGTEICWWLEPEARGGRTAIALLRLAEEWARTRGAVIFQMMAPEANGPLAGLYQRLGYEPIETHYMRRFVA